MDLDEGLDDYFADDDDTSYEDDNYIDDKEDLICSQYYDGTGKDIK